MSPSPPPLPPIGVNRRYLHSKWMSWFNENITIFFVFYRGCEPTLITFNTDAMSQFNERIAIVFSFSV